MGRWDTPHYPVEYYAAAHMFKNVVVGVGRQHSCHDAIALANRLVNADGRMTLANVYVFEAEPRLSTGYGREVEDAERQRAADLLQDARARAGRPAAARWRGAGSVSQGLHEIAERLEADLLVVGMSRQGPVGRALLGDNASATLNRAPCAVAIAPASYTRRAREIRRVALCHDRSSEDAALASDSVDLLILRAQGPLGRFVRLGTRRNLARAAKCPLLVLPRGVDRLAAAEALICDQGDHLAAA